MNLVFKIISETPPTEFEEIGLIPVNSIINKYDDRFTIESDVEICQKQGTGPNHLFGNAKTYLIYET